MTYIHRCPNEILSLIINYSIEKKWGHVFCTLSLVDHRFYEICNNLIKMRMVLETRIACKDILDKKFHADLKSWEFIIHIKTRELLSCLNDSCFNKNYEIWKKLLEITFQENRQSSNHETPLTMVCEYVTDSLFQSSFSTEDRNVTDSRIIYIVKDLLNAGADPNIQGKISTPLMILLMQTPFRNQDTKLAVEVVKLLLRSGANINLKPINDAYRSPLCPIDYAAKNYKAIHSAMVSFLKHESQQ